MPLNWPRLGAAANKPLPLPEAPVLKIVETPPAAIEAPAPRATATKAKPAKPLATVPITLRPTKALLNRYTMAAADRTRATGRVISAQEIMLEQLERLS